LKLSDSTLSFIKDTSNQKSLLFETTHLEGRYQVDGREYELMTSLVEEMNVEVKMRIGDKGKAIEVKIIGMEIEGYIDILA
jgi:hypothetical protein